MAFIARVGAASFPVASDTVYVYDTGTANQVPNLVDLDGVALSQPITIPSSGFWGFDTPDDRKVDIFWSQGARNIAEKVNVKSGNYIPLLSADPSSPATDDIWINTTDQQLKVKVAGGTLIFEAFQYSAD